MLSAAKHLLIQGLHYILSISECYYCSFLLLQERTKERARKQIYSPVSGEAVIRLLCYCSAGHWLVSVCWRWVRFLLRRDDITPKGGLLWKGE